MQPIRGNQPGWIPFYMLFIIVGGFFMMNLFCGVVIDNFMELKEQLGGDVFLTGQCAGNSCFACQYCKYACVSSQMPSASG